MFTCVETIIADHCSLQHTDFQNNLPCKHGLTVGQSVRTRNVGQTGEIQAVLRRNKWPEDSKIILRSSSAASVRPALPGSGPCSMPTGGHVALAG